MAYQSYQYPCRPGGRAAGPHSIGSVSTDSARRWYAEAIDYVHSGAIDVGYAPTEVVPLSGIADGLQLVRERGRGSVTVRVDLT